MIRRRLLDLFCGAGGCSVGYARAGFDVTGVDHVYHESYPDPDWQLMPTPLDVSCTFRQADALAVLRDHEFLANFDAIAASPPCPAYSTITPDKGRHPELIGPVRELLEEWGGPYVIENVEGAASAMVNPVRLCGSSFGLGVRRHRLFASNVPLSVPPCNHAAQPNPVGVYGAHPEGPKPVRRPNGGKRGDRATSLAMAREAMGIEWMDWSDLTDAIPPVYTEHLGRQLLEAL